MAELIERVPELDRAACRAAVEDHFSAERMVAEYLELFSQLFFEPLAQSGRCGSSGAAGRRPTCGRRRHTAPQVAGRPALGCRPMRVTVLGAGSWGTTVAVAQRRPQPDDAVGPQPRPDRGRQREAREPVVPGGLHAARETCGRPATSRRRCRPPRCWWSACRPTASGRSWSRRRRTCRTGSRSSA